MVLCHLHARCSQFAEDSGDDSDDVNPSANCQHGDDAGGKQQRAASDCVCYSSVEEVIAMGEKPIVDSARWESGTSTNTCVGIALAGLGFLAFELLLTHGPPTAWLKVGFQANPKLRQDQIPECIRQAKSRLVGFLHLLIQIPLAFWVMGTPELSANRLIAKTPASMAMLSISAGYFIYDAAVSIVRYEGLAYLVHGVIAGVLYTYGALTGFLSYYGAAFLMWELSTPFVYMRWFLFTLGKTESKAYIINGLLMVGTFFVARNVFGTFMSIDFWRVSGRELAHPTSSLLPAVLWFYRLSCISLNSLNAMWFYKMLKGAIKVLAGPAGAAKNVKGDAHVALRSRKSEALHAAKQPAEGGSKAQKAS
ncbi:hypothetical protein CVIRNUC_011043 [Coccomyxa viridis]|uniref:TLC domain-containing protein n=1 Tax=Coccomyxa viridis TaxID=1274662 RepID=A0AAV1IMF8_9CHLO|nr:hypothetical protein CVIRNUC_011043 [Coccomyxa viridis]